jgi:hypothetical protein
MFGNWFGNNYIKKVNFETLQKAIKDNETIIINTMPTNEQDCLIKNTMNIHKEEETINTILETYATQRYKIIIYGRNCSDDTAEKKYHQLVKLGFDKIGIYFGGLFEWLLLQDIYGAGEFPTTSKKLDILKYGIDSGGSGSGGGGNGIGGKKLIGF